MQLNTHVLNIYSASEGGQPFPVSVLVFTHAKTMYNCNLLALMHWGD